MKDEVGILLGALVSFACAFIPYFFNYLTLPFTIIIFFLVLLVSTNMYSIYRIGKIGIVTNRNALVLNVILDGFIKLQKLSRTKEISISQFINTFCEGIEGIFGG